MNMVETNDTGDATTGGTGSKQIKPQPAAAPEAGLAERLMAVIAPSTNIPKTPGGNAPEPVILEEHIVEKTPAEVTAADVGLKLPTPSPKVSASLTPRPMTMPPAPTPTPVSAPPMKPAEPVLPSTLSIPPIPIEPLPETKLPPPIQAPIPPLPPISAPSPARALDLSSNGENITTDIQRILSQVKLPERREFKGAADPKPPQQESVVPKDLASMVTKPPTDAETARAMASKQEAAPVSSVHTLKDDLQHAVREKKMSLVRAVALEQDKKRDEFVEEEFGRKARRKRVSGILFATFLLFGLGIAALFGVYFVMMSHSATGVESLNSLVFAEQSVALPLDNSTPSELKRRIAVARQGQVGSLGSITRIVPIFQGSDPNAQPVQATTAQLFTTLGLNAPDDLTHSLGSTFFLGLHVVDKNAPVLVIPVTNYDRAFAGMLAWEATMNSDLSPAFTPVPSTILDVNGIPSARVFMDDVMRNYDVRELKDDSGTVQLYYSFPSKNLLIIAESPYSFPELLSRLQSVRRL